MVKLVCQTVKQHVSVRSTLLHFVGINLKTSKFLKICPKKGKFSRWVKPKAGLEPEQSVTSNQGMLNSLEKLSHALQWRRVSSEREGTSKILYIVDFFSPPKTKWTLLLTAPRAAHRPWARIQWWGVWASLDSPLKTGRPNHIFFSIDLN